MAQNFDVSLRKNVSSKSLILGDDDLLSAVKVDGVSWRAHYFLPPRKNVCFLQKFREHYK